MNPFELRVPKCEDCGIEIEAGFSLCRPCADEAELSRRVDDADDDRRILEEEQRAIAEMDAALEPDGVEIIGIL